MEYRHVVHGLNLGYKILLILISLVLFSNFFPCLLMHDDIHVHT